MALNVNDHVEIHCRPFTIDGSSDLVKKVREKVSAKALSIPGQKKGQMYRITYTKMPNSGQLARMGEREKHEWWREKVMEVGSFFNIIGNHCL